MQIISKTAALTAPRTFSIIDRAIPALAPDHVVVRIAATAVCHTDLGIYKGLYANLKYPVVMGHESTGVVESAGEKVTQLAFAAKIPWFKVMNIHYFVGVDGLSLALLLLTALVNLIVLAGLSVELQYVAKALVLVGAVAIQTVARRTG